VAEKGIARLVKLTAGVHLWTTISEGYGRNEPEELFLDPSWFTRSAVIVGKSGTDKSHDIDLMLRFMVSRLEAESHIADMRMLGRGCRMVLDRDGGGRIGLQSTNRGDSGWIPSNGGDY